jgi:hypothetical protein
MKKAIIAVAAVLGVALLFRLSSTFDVLGMLKAMHGR